VAAVLHGGELVFVAEPGAQREFVIFSHVGESTLITHF
jgi:hypothetical protein